MNTDKKAKIEYVGLSRLNKPIRFHGLSSLQLGSSFLVTVILFIIMSTSQMSLLGLFFLTGTWIILLKGPLKKLNKEYKKGTPNYLSSYFSFSSTPRKIRDKHHIFSFIIKK